MTLQDYLRLHTWLCHAQATPEAEADVIFFGICKGRDASAEGLRAAIAQHKGEYNDVNLFDGEEHNYIQLGGWVGDQEMALRLIGLGYILGLWKLLTPRTVLAGFRLDDKTVMSMASAGFVAMQAPKPQ